MEPAPRVRTIPRWAVPAAGGLVVVLATLLYVAIDAAVPPAAGPEGLPAASLPPLVPAVAPVPAVPSRPGLDGPVPPPAGQDLAVRSSPADHVAAPERASTSGNPDTGGTSGPASPTVAAPRDRSERPALVERGSTGFLTVVTVPPSRVRLDRRDLGLSPILRREVATGIHTLAFTLMASASRVSKQRRITILSGQLTSISERLDASEAGSSSRRRGTSGRRRVPVE